MGLVVEFIPKRSGTTAGGLGGTVAPMRRSARGVGEPASQCERLGEVVVRVLEGLTVSPDDHGNVTGLWKTPGKND